MDPIGIIIHIYTGVFWYFCWITDAIPPHLDGSALEQLPLSPGDTTSQEESDASAKENGQENLESIPINAPCM